MGCRPNQKYGNYPKLTKQCQRICKHTFIFSMHKPNAKNKKELAANARDIAKHSLTPMNVNRFGQAFMLTSDDTSSYADSGDADNKKIHDKF